MLLKQYKKSIQVELQERCAEIIELIDQYLLPKSSLKPKESGHKSEEPEGDEMDPENKVYFLKMKGDYYRYICEYTTGTQNENAKKKAQGAYEMAVLVADEHLEPTNAIKLGLYLNYSVFWYEILSNRTKACEMAKVAFDGAVKEIQQEDEDKFKDSL